MTGYTSRLQGNMTSSRNVINDTAQRAVTPV